MFFSKPQYISNKVYLFKPLKIKLLNNLEYFDIETTFIHFCIHQFTDKKNDFFFHKKMTIFQGKWLQTLF